MRVPPAIVGTLLLAACSADRHTLGAPQATIPHPSFVLGAAGIEDTSCDYNVAWVRDGGLNPFSISFGSSQCGNLQFQDQTRTVGVTWVPVSGVFPSGYNTWQLKERRLQGQDTMYAFPPQWVPADSQASASLAFPLSSRADAIGLRLFINTTGAVATTPAEFDGTVDEAAVQHWSHIEAPAADSVVAWSQATVRLFWQNNNHGRSYDATEIWRDGDWVGRTYGTTHTFTDDPVPAGTHYYQIRHVTPSSPQGLGLPNSAYTPEDTVVLPPQDYANFICCDVIVFMDSTYVCDDSVYGGTAPIQHQWWYSDSTKEHDWSDPTTVGENSPTYSLYVTRPDSDYAFRLTDSTTDANGRRVGYTSYNYVLGTDQWFMASSDQGEAIGHREGRRCVPLPASRRERHEWIERAIRSGRSLQLCVVPRRS